MENVPPTTPAAAQASLAGLDAAREHIAERVTSPWWYRLGAALSTASLFVGMGLLVGRPDAGSTAETASTLLIVLGACVAPGALLWGLSLSTGVSLDRYSSGMTAWYVVVFSLLAVAFVLQQFLGVPFALAAAGVPAFVATIRNEHRLDALLRDRVRAGGPR